MHRVRLLPLGSGGFLHILLRQLGGVLCHQERVVRDDDLSIALEPFRDDDYDSDGCMSRDQLPFATAR